MLQRQVSTLLRSSSFRTVAAGFRLESARKDASGTLRKVATVPEPCPPAPAKLKGVDGWQIFSAVVISRHPVLVPPMSQIQHTYSQHLSKLEVEKSLKCDFELDIIEENQRTLLGDRGDDSAAQPQSTEASLLEQLDNWKDEKQQYEENKVTHLEVKPDSIGSSLMRQVVLMHKHKLGASEQWLIPQGAWRPGESLRQTSERIVAECVDPALNVRIMNSSPIGFYKYKYPKELRAQGYIGAKIFFYRGQVGCGVFRSLPILSSAPRPNQRWLTHDQIAKELPPSYVKALKLFLINDG